MNKMLRIHDVHDSAEIVPGRKTIVGYASDLSVARGSGLNVMVSSEDETYEAEVVQVLHGDPNPEGPGFRTRPVTNGKLGTFRGVLQPLRLGSYIRIMNGDAFQRLESFTLTCWIYPTATAGRDQAVLGAWDEGTESGFGLFLREGVLEMRLGRKEGPTEILQLLPFRLREWYFAAGGFDSERGLAWLHQSPQHEWPTDPTRGTHEWEVARGLYRCADAFLIGACSSAAGAIAGHYNGKLEAPAVFDYCMTSDELARWWRTGASARPPLAEWDFAREIDTDRVEDIAGEAHGIALNLPTRGVTGRSWTGQTSRWSDAPDQYAAIHFHEDDLEDASWEKSFTVNCGNDWASDVYAVRLTSRGSIDYVPLIVTPAEEDQKELVAVLLPTFTYEAYTNARVFGESQFPPPRVEQPEDRYVHEKRLLSLYDHHSDGSGVCYATRLRPLMSLRPTYRAQNTGCPARLSADLYLTDWLREMGFAFDVITDECVHTKGVGVLDGYRVVLTGTHPEYVSREILDALQHYINGRGQLMYLGGNGFYCVASRDPRRPHILEVRRGELGLRIWRPVPGELFHTTTGEEGGTWRARGRSPQQLVGVGFTSWGIGPAAPYRRTEMSTQQVPKFVFEGVDPNEEIGNFGLTLGGAAGYEVDRLDYGLGSPPYASLLASSSDLNDYVPDLADVDDLYPPVDRSRLIRADMVYFETSGRGRVFGVGSIAWCGSLSANNYDNNVSRITKNVLCEFLRERA